MIEPKCATSAKLTVAAPCGPLDTSPTPPGEVMPAAINLATASGADVPSELIKRARELAAKGASRLAVFPWGSRYHFPGRLYQLHY
jgi:hypothetical protein